MEDVLICPNCGEANPPELPYCQHCQWRLRPLTGELGTDPGTGSSNRTDSDSNAASAHASVPDWLRLAHDQSVEKPRAPKARPADGARGGSKQPDEDLLAGLTDQGPSDEKIPDWVAHIMGIEDRGQKTEETSQEDDGRFPEKASPWTAMPRQDIKTDWGKDRSWSKESQPEDIDLGESEGSVPPNQVSSEEPAVPEDAEINEWLRRLDATAAQEQEPQPPPGVPATTDVPTWVDRMMGVTGPSVKESRGPVPGGVPATTDVPTWVDRMMGVTGVAARESAGPGDALPDWLTPSAVTEEEVTDASEEPQEPLTWQGSSTPPTIDGSSVEGVPRTAGTDDAQKAIQAFRPEDVQRLDVDAIFASMQMPEWLADVTPQRPASSRELPPAAREEEAIAPADLPSWVEAMRPVESAVVPSPNHEADNRLEEQGPLLGLHGILPAIPGAAMPSSKPKSHSMKVDASEQHQAHARLLEEMLSAETKPLPIKGIGEIRSQRVVRWAISGALVTILGGVVLSRSANFRLPAAVPNESNAAIQAVSSLPPGAMVLVVFDYDPATVGEMEATAAPLFEYLLLLKHPRMAVISTLPTGSALAERFISGALADRAYVRDVQYANLGYLPGGLTGVRSFAQDPTVAAPLGASINRVWDSGVLLGTRQLSDFAAIIVITDSLENGRVWIEQTAGAHGSSRMIIVSSAQAGPMLLPYFDSGQVDGLIAGLNGAAGAETANGGLPGLVRRYWDAYSVGLYLAVLLISLGAVWQLWLGLRERAVGEA
jgi:hypothetical protein